MNVDGPNVRKQPKKGENMLTIENIAKICHEANKAYCRTQGDYSQPSWRLAPDWQRESAINGVKFHLDSPESSPEDSHNNWLKEKEKDGWVYGPEKNPEKKEHPCMVPYSKLPENQRAKDYLFSGIIETLKPFLSD